MGNLKAAADIFDVLVKAALAIAAFWFVDFANNQATQTKMLAEQTKVLAEAQSVGRKDDAELTKMIIDLLFKQNLSCLTEDQMVIVGFLSEMNDQYNRVKLGDRMLGAVRHRGCESQNSALAKDLAPVKGTSSSGTVPTVLPHNIGKVLASLKNVPAFEEAETAETAGIPGKDFDGFVALGRSVGSGFTNFSRVTGSIDQDGRLTTDSILRARSDVYLRSNTSNTEAGSNPIIGLIPGGQCVQPFITMPNLRGQTWAQIKLVDCPK